MARQRDLDQTWARIQSILRTSFPESTYQNWLAGLQPKRVDDAALFVEMSGAAGDWVRRRFGPALTKAAREADPSIERVEMIEARQEPSTGHSAAVAEPASGAAPSSFKPGYTFDRFVIGKTNHFAHAAALAAAEMPGHAYNPLLVHGPPGVGKTHLLQAIGNYVSTHDTSLTVHYTTTEGFTGDFTRALQLNGLHEFKSTYRRCDVLLLDDLQFLEGKPKTTEEFLHTFDSLMSAGAQIVITSDREASQISFLEDRFKERLQAGLTIQLAPPNYTTRLAILRKLIALNEADIPSDVVAQLAERITSNIRALEGALIRIVAFASLSESTITTALADQVLASLYSDSAPAPQPAPKPRASQIQDSTARALGIEVDELTSTRRSRPVVYARQVAMYLCRELADLSYPEIARHFNRRDHTTALHAHRKIKAQLLSDPATRKLVAAITHTVSTGLHSAMHKPSTPKTAAHSASKRSTHRSAPPNHH